MKIKVLAENTSCNDKFLTEHGLSLYIETENNKILFDMGQTDVFVKNADILNVDISDIDYAVISHGHYDHGGGLETFFKENQKAVVYLNRYAFEPHFSGTEKYIGLDVSLKDNKRLIFTDNYFKIDENTELFSFNENQLFHKINPFGLNVMENDKLTAENFRHEQYMLIKENDKKILISGCSHKGILNIMEWAKPDVLIGGFHFMKIDTDGDGKETLEKSAEILNNFDTIYYTCHCTGTEQYKYLKKFMKDNLHYISTGYEFIV